MRKSTVWKRSLSLLLALSMMFSLFSINAFAAEPDETGSVQEETSVAVTEEVVTEPEETEPEVPEVPEQPEEPDVTEPETPEVPAETEETEPEVPAETEDETEDAEEPAEETEEPEDAEAEDELDDEALAEDDLMDLEDTGISVFAVAKPCSVHSNTNYWKYTPKNDTLHSITCTSCKKSVKDEQHSMEWVVTKEATLDASGERTYQCTLCGFSNGETETYEAYAQIKGGSTYASLQEALKAVESQYENGAGAQTEWTVTLLQNTTESVEFYARAYSSGNSNITLTIDLNGKTLTGNGDGPVITLGKLNSSNATVQFIIADSQGTGVVTGGNASDGGAVYLESNSRTSLTITGGTFTGNTANRGGAIFSSWQQDVPVYINGGTFTNNTAAQGGAVYARTLTVNGGTFTGNHANIGGAINVVNGYEAGLTISGGIIYGNTASEYGDDIAVGQTDSMDRYKTSLVLMSASAMGVEGIDAWLVDGYGLNGETARASDDNRVVFTADQWPTSAGRVRVGLKAGLSHEHTAGEAVEENHIDATCNDFGSYDMVTYCEICGKEMSRESFVIDQLEAVAEVDGVKYETLQEALDAVRAQYNDTADTQTVWTVTLLKDTTECVAITAVTSLKNNKNMTLTIDLNGNTINGDGSGSVITVAKTGSTNATVQFIIEDSVGTGTVTGGNTVKNGGGAIYVSGGNSNTTLIINGGNFTGNTAANGGVISSNYQSDVPVVINGGNFTGNTATGNGGVVYARSLTVNGGTFTGNTAGKGGAIYVVGTGWTANLKLNNAVVYGNTAAEYGADIVFGLAGKYTRQTTLNLMDASAMGLEGTVDAWLVDGYGLDGEADRVSDANRVIFTADQWPNTNKTGPALIALKADLGHTHTAGEAVEENRVEATYDAPGSYDLVTYCDICGKEMSRETVEIAQLVPAPVAPVIPVDSDNGSSATGSTTSTTTETTNNDNDTPAAPVTPADPTDPTPEEEDAEAEIPEEDVPMAAPAETEVAAVAPEADEEPVIIDEEDTPLATIGESSSAAWSLLNLVLALVTVLLSLMMLASYFKAKSNTNLVSIIPAVFALVTFMATSNLSGSMTFADSWTPAMLLFAALNAGVVAFAMKKQKESAK